MLFSIIIPVYNVAPYLRECLDSVRAQTFGDWEAICVDDGSTDGSGAILDEYAAKDPRFRVFHQANAGVSAARNKALDVAKGEWIWFVDGDDVINFNSLQTILDLLHEAKGVGLIKIGYIRFKNTDKVEFANDKSDSNIMNIASDIPISILDVMCCQVIYNRNTIGKIRFLDYIGGEDRVFACSCLSAASKILVIETSLYGYRQREDSVMHRKIEYRKVHDDLCSLIETCKICDASGKNMPFIKIEWARAYFTDRCLAKAMLLKESDQNIIWSIWRAAIGQLRCIDELSIFERFELCLARKLPNFDSAVRWLRLMNRIRKKVCG